MPCRSELVLQGLPAAVTAKTLGRLHDPQDVRPPGQASSPPLTAPGPPEPLRSARDADPQFPAAHRLPSSSPSGLARMEDMPLPHESETHLPRRRPAKSAGLEQSPCEACSYAHLSLLLNHRLTLSQW